MITKTIFEAGFNGLNPNAFLHILNGLTPLAKFRIIEPSDTGAVPDGYKLVPIVPTDAMEDAAFYAFAIDNPGRFKNGTEVRNEIYREMIEAAPATPQPALAQVETEPTENDNEAISRVRNNVANKGYAFLFDDIATLMRCYDANPLPAQAENSEQEDTWGRFAAWLLDKCEGEIITEEFLQKALSDMLANTVAL